MALPSRDPAFFDIPAVHARSRAGASALAFEGREIRYDVFAQACERVAAGLWEDWGVRPGERVTWLGAGHPAQLVLLFALARIGAMLLPLNNRLALPEWQALVADCAPRHLVHDASFEGAARDLGLRTGIAVHSSESLDEFAAREGPGPAPVHGTPSSQVLLVYTSGTTGRARAAVHTQANLLANMQIAAQVQEIGPEDVVATMLPLFHVGGLCIQTLPALLAGAKVVLHPRFAPAAAFDCFERDRPTLTLQVPATMKALLDHPRWDSADLSSLRAVWAGSSVLPRSLVDAFNRRGLPVCNVYGATETGPFSLALPPQFAASHAGSCGWPAPGVEVALADAKEGVGELLVRGPNVVARYWPDQPACDDGGWFHTGDLASKAADGSYTVAGRARDLIISGGENIHPGEIESLLAGHPAIADCAAFALPSQEWGEVVAVAVVLKPGLSVSEQELHAQLAGRLARYKLPRHWFFVDALPKTALGKIQRSALAALAGQESGPGAALPSDESAGRTAVREASHTSNSTGTPSSAVAVKKLT